MDYGLRYLNVQGLEVFLAQLEAEKGPDFTWNVDSGFVEVSEEDFEKMNL